MTGKRQSLWAYFKERTKTNWVLFAVMIAYSALCIGSAIYCLVTGRYRDIVYSFVFLAVVPVFYIVERYLHIKMPMGCVAVLLIFMAGSFVGACYNVYTLFRNLDDVLHGFWGVLFTLLGFGVIKAFLGEPDTKKKFFACLLFAFAFCLMIAVFWEIYEFSLDQLSTNYDMQEDTIVNNIYSFYLFPSYDHLNTEKIEGIAYTILYDADGNVIYTIEGGYLDIGIYDTMMDILWCTFAAAASCIILAIDWFAGKRLNRWFVPALRKEAEAVETVETQLSEAPPSEEEQEELKEA